MRGVAYDLDLPLVIGKTHPAAETLLKQIAQPALVIVMIRRSQKRSAQSAARDIGEIPFDRLGLGDVDLIKVGLGKTKRVPLEKVSI